MDDRKDAAMSGGKQKIKLKCPVVVEGKYDKIRLSSLIDALIIPTEGFRIFKDRKKLAMLRTLAQREGIVIITDSDRAGFAIRHYLQSCIPAQQITHVYIPDIFGKESRKKEPSKEGKLGVEGLSSRQLIDALRSHGVPMEGTAEDTPQIQKRLITKMDLYEDGIVGSADSFALRRKLLKSLQLPENLSANALVNVINRLIDFEQYRKLVEQLKQEVMHGRG